MRRPPGDAREPDVTAARLLALRAARFRHRVAGRIRGPRAALAFVEQVGFCSTFHRFPEGAACLWEAVVGRARPRWPRRSHHDAGLGLTWALKDELPERVVQNSAVFSVLSLGIHELTEEQCTQYFPVLKAVLFQMLEQEEHKRKAALTARETDAAFSRILADLGEQAAQADEAAVTGGP